MKHLLNNDSIDILSLIDQEINQFITEDEEEVNFPSSDGIKDSIKRLVISAFNRGEKYGRFYTLMELKEALKDREEMSEDEAG